MKGDMWGKQAGVVCSWAERAGTRGRTSRDKEQLGLQPQLAACDASLPPAVAALRHHRWAALRDDLHAVMARQWEGCAGENWRNPTQQWSRQEALRSLACPSPPPARLHVLDAEGRLATVLVLPLDAVQVGGGGLQG